MVRLIGDKIFELISKMYSDINSKLDEINKKSDMKVDENNIVIQKLYLMYISKDMKN